MTQQIINIGSAANDGKGDSLRSAGIKMNANFTELYSTKVPDLFGNANKVLSTNGTSLFWVPSTVNNAIQTTTVYNDPTWIGTLAYTKLTGRPTIPTLVSQLANDSGYVTTTYTLPTASTSVLGGVKVDGSTVNINNGVISISSGLSGSVVFRGGWNANTNTPTLINGVGTSGSMYIVTVAGTRDLGAGSFGYSAGDLLVYDGSNWIDVSSNSGIVSFNSRSGAVTLLNTDVTTALGYTPIQSSSLSITTNPASGVGSLTYSAGVFTFTPYALPTATSSVLGGVKVDNNTIVINSGVISVGGALTSATIFKGSWDANTNTPTLVSNIGTAGYEYIVSVAGTRNLGNGSKTYSVGDLLIYDGTNWAQIPGGNSVTTFNTRQGAITLTSSDVTTALGTQAANKVLAGPATGADATPTFRALVATDIPALTGYINTSSTGQTITDTSGTTNYSLKIANGTTGAVFGIGTGTNAFGIANDALNNTITGYVPYTVTASTITLKAGTVPATVLSIASNGSITVANDIIGATTQNVFNTISTTINAFASATTALKIGASNAPISGFAATATSTSTAASLGYLGMPQQSKSSAYTTVIGDAGKHIYVTATATITIDSNANVAYPIGTTIAFIAAAGATVTIAITTDTMYLGGTGTTGSRTLAPYGMATAVKVTSTSWFINGAGLT